MTATPDNDGVTEHEPDLSWFLIAVGRKSCVILDYAPGWSEFEIEFHFEDTFDCEPPMHLAYGAYRWTDYTFGSWDEDDAISIRGGSFTPFAAQVKP